MLQLKKKSVLVMLIMLFVVMMSACSKGSNPSTSELAKESEKSVIEKPAEMTLAAPRDLAPGSEDAYYTSVILYVWEPLIAGGEDGKPIPKLAESWNMSEDGKEWTFKLRENVTFHDGEELNADAVLANFARYKQVSPKSSPFYTLNIEHSYPGLQDVVKVDELSFKLVFDKPQPTLLYSMVNFSSPIYSPKNFAENGDFNGLPQGTGPFKLVEHEKDSYALLKANENYYGEKAKTDTIRIKVIPDPDTRLAALKAGEIFGVMDLGAIPPEQAQELTKDDRFELSVTRSTISHYVHPNGKTGLFADRRLRKAASLAIDRKMIVAELYRGYPIATANILNATSPFYKEVPMEHDLEKAKELAGKVLGADRKNVRLIVPSYGINRYPYKAQAELIQYQLKEIGLDVEIQILDGAAFKEAQANGEYDLALATQGLPNGEPFTIFNNYLHSEGSSNISYSLGYKNERVDDLLAQAATQLDLEKRQELYNEIQDIAVEEFPTIPLFNDASLIAFNKQIKGYEALLYGTTLAKLEWAN